MITLRQRLLLVVGWVVAAVGIGLVSAGAVAVAGGQVTDRPLRPLSAAEVAALPVTIEEDCVTNGPLASGGSDGASCSVALGSDLETSPADESAQPAEREPAGADAQTAPEASATSPDGPTLSSGGDDGSFEDEGLEATGAFPEGIDGPPIGPRPPEPEIVELIGGQVRITASTDGLVLNGASPRPGFVADVLFSRSDQLTVTFWNGSHLSTIVATLSDGTLGFVLTESGP